MRNTRRAGLQADALGAGRPRGARGIAPLLVAAAGAGILRAGVGMRQNRSETRRQRNLINDAYADSAKRLGTNQAAVRQSTDETLARRGLSQMSAAPRATIAGTYGGLVGGENGRAWGVAPTTLQGPAATTLGQQTVASTERELGYERKDLDFQHQKANADNDAQSRARTVQAVGDGINTAMSIYGAGRSSAPAAPTGGVADASTPGAMPPLESASSISSAYQQNAFRGIDPVNPWGTGANPNRGTILGGGGSNAAFNVG